MSDRSAAQRRHPSPGPSAYATAGAVALPARRADFTLAHAGHQLRLGPIAFWIVVGTLVIMAGWTVVTATYFAFREDVLTRLINREAKMQFAYEDRIAEMRAQVDRVTSRQLLDQNQIEQKLDRMLRRQATLESHAAMLGGVLDPESTGSVRNHSRGREHAGRAKPSPISDTVLFRASPHERQAKAGGIEATLQRLQDSMDRVEERQTAALDEMEQHYDGRANQVRTVLAGLGVDVAHLRPNPQAGIGGPFIRVKPPTGGSFDRELYRVSVARAQLDRLTQSLSQVPLRKPIARDLDMTSPFGVRSDPFMGEPAMHTGDDFRAAPGDGVYATASGTVSIAGWTGGYGRLVEIRHGDGLATRYGHLSQILVHVGQKVKVGQMIGRVGSTGRSTGPHLHYETRVGGEPVDPQKFLRAGAQLGTAL